MRKLAIGVLSVLMAAVFTAAAFAQHGARGTSSITIKGKTISVDYGQPALHGRTTESLLGRLPAGSFWRMGSNGATDFKTDVDLAFGDATVPAGEYSIWMQRQEGDSWKLVFNKQHGQWGTEHDTSQDFASAPMQSSTASQPVETLTITLHKKGSGGSLTVQWGTLETVANFQAK